MDINFEDKLKRLQEITNQIENSSLSLSDSIKLYEEGLELSRELETALKQAENNVEQIIESKK